MAKQINVGLIGQAFMGRTHSNAWSQVNKFFDLPLKANLHTISAKNADTLPDFARNWGWANHTTRWKSMVTSDEIDLVDVGTPNHLHKPMAIAALEAGKHVACEKPLAGTLDDAREMVKAARKAAKKGAQTFVWYNYRRCPAVALAQEMVKAGKIGEILHVRGYYLQDWADPSVPLAWRFQKKYAGSGAHGDLNAHIIDMTRFVTGQEITEISGAIAETFIKERPKMSGSAAGGIAGGLKKGKKKGRVSVDDCVLFLARFEGGAVAKFEAARQATGHQNYNGFEINGTKGSIQFNFERMNELEYYDATASRATQGWTTIMCTHAPDHPYVEAWWPDAHIIGYEHGFTNQASDILRMLAGKKPIVPMPDFEDAYQTQRVLEASLISAREKCAVKMSQVK
ncbi:MAG: Gfo/Idh/MocA family protein [Phycisphaerae bacterium]